MTLKQELTKLTTVSNRIAAIEFKKGPTDIIDAVLGKKRKFVRDARPDENKLAAMCVGDSAIQEMMPAVTNVPKRPTRESLALMMNQLKALNEVCKDPIAAKKLEELERRTEKKAKRIENLRKTVAENDREWKEYERMNAQQEEMETDEEEYEEEENDDDDDSENDAEIARLELELKQIKEQRKEVARKKEEQLEIQKKFRKMASRQAAEQSATQLAELKEIERLKEENKLKKRRIAEYDRLLAEPNVIPSAHIPSSSQREAYTGFRAKIEQLFTSSVGNGEATASATVLIDTFKSVETELQDILSRMESVESVEKQNNAVESITLKLLKYVNKQMNSNEEEKQIDKDDLEQFNKVFPHNIHTTVPSLKPSKDTQILAPILLKLFNQGKITLSNLNAYVEELAREKGMADKDAIRLIYKLVSMDLIVIDRTHKDSIVRLNFSTTTKK